MNLNELDKAAINYFNDKGQIEERFITKSTLKLCIPYLNNNKVLQLGLGNGFIAKQIDDLVANQVVIEGSQKLVDEFSYSLKNTRVVNGFFENFEIEGKFDVVLANHVLEHVDDPVSVLNHLKNFLTSDGKILITVPNAMSLHRRIGVEMKLLNTIYELNSTDKAVGHRRVYDLNLLKTHIHQAGYNVIAERGYLIKLVSLKQMMDWNDNLLDAIYEVSLTIPAETCSNLFIVIEKQ